MTRTTRRDLVLILVWALAFQAIWMVRLVHPSYFDAYYYTTNAQRLAAGEGFTEEIIWQYLDDPEGLPHASHTYWMPLPSLIAAAGYALAGTFRAAQLPFWLMAGLLPLLTYAISWRIAGERWQARTAALFTAAGGYYAAYWNQPTTFALFAWTGGGCLLALAWAQQRALERNAAWLWLVSGLAAGLSHLARADGVLLVVVAALVWVWWWRERRPAVGHVVAAAALMAGGYLLVMGPWFWHSYQVSGSMLSTVGTQTIFLTEYNDVFAYGRTFDLEHYLAWGWDNILRSKLSALWLALQTFIAVTGLTAFVVFVVVGWAALWRKVETRRFLRPVTLYTLVLYGTMSLIFTFPGQHGSLLHSSTAIWPWSMALVPAGIGASIDWIAERRRTWRPQQARIVFAVGFLVIGYAVTFFAAGNQPLRREEAAIYRELATYLPEGAVVMTGDPPGLHYHTGRRAIAVPNEEPDRLLAVAAHYGADYLLLDPEMPAALAAIAEDVAAYPELRLVAEPGDGFRLFALEGDR
jgi:hypothetical protein